MIDAQNPNHIGLNVLVNYLCEGRYVILLRGEAKSRVKACCRTLFLVERIKSIFIIYQKSKKKPRRIEINHNHCLQGC